MRRLLNWFGSDKQPSRFTAEEALQRGRKYGHEAEVKMAMKHGCNPDEALQDWDIYPYQEEDGRDEKTK